MTRINVIFELEFYIKSIKRNKEPGSKLLTYLRNESNTRYVEHFFIKPAPKPAVHK